MLGCYRKADCADPEVFATAAVAVLSRYPADVARKVTDPHYGLPATSKWVPTIAELRDACEVVNNAAKRRIEQEERVKAQFAERERMEAMTDSERRKDFIKRKMAWIESQLASANSDKPAPPIDVRHMDPGPDKDRLVRKLEADIARQAERNKSAPLTLSELGRKTNAGRPPEPLGETA